MSSWNDPYLQKLYLDRTPLIDVRAPVEFMEGSLPHSINLPIMNNEERTLVGTCYKNEGQEAAIRLGHSLVGGQLKEERIENWKTYIDRHPGTQVFCFRGGLRSQITCQWLREKRLDLYPIEGGYKRMRKFFLSGLEEAPLARFIRLGGLTGSGKTRILKKIQSHIDIEGLGNHRGSAFGYNGPQPSQVRFENLLALELLKVNSGTVWVEDESVTLGKLTIPARIFSHLRQSSLVILTVDLEKRINNIFEDYVLHSTPEFFLGGIDRISNRLGGVRSKTLKEKIISSYGKSLARENHAEWISTLLTDYYDPFYQKAILTQAGLRIFEGNEEEVLEFSRSGLIS